MAEKTDMEMKLSAFLDGALGPDESREVEAWLAEDPDAAAELSAMRGAGSLLKREAEGWDAGVDFSDFSSKVMARIEAESPAGAGASGGGFLDRLKVGLAAFVAAHRSAVAAAATMLVILGGGSFYYLTGFGAEVPLEMRGGTTVIEDLSFGDASAVVYRTEADVTVIWVTED
jgi:anti-sigma factor RsiW